MAGAWVNKRVLITVRTYPVPAQKYSSLLYGRHNERG